jgi:hypothetical protein
MSVPNTDTTRLIAGGRRTRPAELLVELPEDDLLGAHRVARLDHRLDLVLLLLRERHTNPLQRGHTLDRVVQRLAELQRRRRGVLPNATDMSSIVGGLVKMSFPFPAPFLTFVNVSNMFSPDWIVSS